MHNISDKDKPLHKMNGTIVNNMNKMTAATSVINYCIQITWPYYIDVKKITLIYAAVYIKT